MKTTTNLSNSIISGLLAYCNQRQSKLKSRVSGLLIGVSGLPSPEYPAPNPEYLAYTGQTGHKFLPSPR